MEGYIKSLENTPYVWWKEGDKVGKGTPFWAENNESPSTNLVKKDGCNCAGFINLICRFLKKSIPGIDDIDDPYVEWAGGSWYWFQYLKNTNQLEEFDPQTIYPEGTLLLRDYKSVEDQGHLALFLKGGKVAHSYPGKGIVIEDSALISHYWIPEGYYTHISRFLIQ